MNENNEAENNLLQMPIAANQARVNVTYKRANGDLPDPVFVDTPPAQLLTGVTEALRNGDIPGIPKDETADLTGFVVEPFEPTEQVPHHRIFIRPKTEFGAIALDVGLALGSTQKTVPLKEIVKNVHPDAQVTIKLTLEKGTMGAPFATVSIYAS